MTIDLWAARLERPLTEQEMERLLPLLPAERRERLRRLRRKEWRREPLCAYALLQLALRERYGWQTLPEVETTEGGKPWFPRHPEVHFSISHTDGAVLVGIGETPIGVDVEKVRPVSARTMNQVAGAATEMEFFQTWVRREARTKRSGAGVAPMLRKEPLMEPGEHYREAALFPGYSAGVSVCGDAPEIKVRVCSMEELLASVGE